MGSSVRDYSVKNIIIIITTITTTTSSSTTNNNRLVIWNKKNKGCYKETSERLRKMYATDKNIA